MFEPGDRHLSAKCLAHVPDGVTDAFAVTQQAPAKKANAVFAIQRDDVGQAVDGHAAPGAWQNRPSDAVRVTARASDVLAFPQGKPEAPAMVWKDRDIGARQAHHLAKEHAVAITLAG